MTSQISNNKHEMSDINMSEYEVRSSKFNRNVSDSKF